MEVRKLGMMGRAHAVTIPVEYMRHLGWMKGIQMAVLLKGDHVELRSLESYVIKTRETDHVARGRGIDSIAGRARLPKT